MTQRTYTDIESLFQLKLPEDWLLDTSGQMGVRVAMVAPEMKNDFQANVTVVVNHIPPLTKEEYLTLSRLQLKQVANLPMLPVDEPSGERPGSHVFQWLNNQAPVPLTIRQQVFFTETKAFILTATDLQQNFTTQQPIFDTIFRSFQLTG